MPLDAAEERNVLQEGAANHPGPLVITCEHASCRLPPPYQAAPEDRRLLHDHWGWDPGAADVARALRAATGSVAFLANFSRLLVDPNRPVDAPDLVRRRAEGHTFSFNREVDAAEQARRVERLYRPYHEAIEAALVARRDRDTLLFSVHSFTPCLDGEPREMELGVLFDEHEPLAVQLAGALRRAGFVVALNAPYSGRDGLVYSAHRHGTAHGVPYLEVEVRNDLVTESRGVARVADALKAGLDELLGG